MILAKLLFALIVTGVYSQNHEITGTGDYVWETEVIANGGYFHRSEDQTQIIFDIPGKYFISYNVRLGTSSEGEAITLLRKNGVNMFSTHNSESDPTKTHIAHACGIVELSIGDVVTVNLFTGTIRKGNVGVQTTNLNIMKID